MYTQKVSLNITYFQKMAKRAVGIEQKGSKLYNIQNLTAFWSRF